MKKIWRWKWLISLFLLILIFGPFLWGRAWSGSYEVQTRENEDIAAGTFQGSKIKVVAYNIAHGRGATDSNFDEPAKEKRERVAKIAEWIQQQNADVVVLNEVDFSATWSDHQNQAAAIAKQAGFRFWVEQRNMDLQMIYGRLKCGNAVLSKFPIHDARIIRYPEPNRWERWVCGIKEGVVCTIQLDSKNRIRIFGVHTDFRKEETRLGSVKAILKEAGQSEVPLIALGDFNSTPTRLPCSNQTADGGNAMETLEAAEYFAPLPVDDKQPKLTFSSTRPHTLIDWILIPKKFTYLSYEVPDSQLSDHLPVVAEIEIK